MSKQKAPAEQAQVDAEVRPETKPPEGEKPVAGNVPPAGDAPPDAPASDKPAEKQEPTTPEYWARKLGHVAKKASPLDVNGKRRPLHFDAAHAAADQLHGWSLHKQHTTDPLVLSQSDYEAALSAALSPKGRHYVPHTGALSKFAKKRAEERAKRRAERLKSTKGGE